MAYREYSPRPAVEEDLDQVVAIEKQCMQPPWSREAFRAEFGKASTRFWVVTDNETDTHVLAYVVFSFPAEQAHIQTFAVSPAHRRQGVAKYLLRQVISFVMREKGESIVLEVRKGNAAAVQLYQGLGFIVLHTISRFYPDGEDAYSMIYRVEQNRLTGDYEQEFDEDDGPSGDRKNLN